MRVISPNSLALKRYLKVPMVLLVFASATVSGLSVVMLKLFGELIQSREWQDYYGLMLAMLCILVLCGGYQLHLVNQAMKYYDQMEAVPVYQTSLMIMWILSGLIILQESKNYSTLGLLAIFGSILLCCIGIKFLTMKRKMLKTV